MRIRPSSTRQGVASRFAAFSVAAVLLAEVALPAAARADGGNTSVHAVEDLANQGYAQATAGKYAEAIASYMKAYEISRTAALLFNIAVIYDRRLHERSLAIEYYRRYLEAADANPEFARKSAERLSALKAEAAAEERARSSVQIAPPPAAPAQAAPTTPSAVAPAAATAPASGEASPPGDVAGPAGGSALRPAGAVVGAIGLAAIGAALGLGAVAKSKGDQANGYCGASWCSSSQGVTLDQQAASLATASTVTFVAGAALLVTGVTLFLVAPRAKSPSAASIAIRPRLGLSRGGLSFDASF